MDPYRAPQDLGLGLPPSDAVGERVEAVFLALVLLATGAATTWGSAGSAGQSLGIAVALLGARTFVRASRNH